MPRLLLCTLAIFLLLSGCKIGPNYTRPDLDIPAAYQYETLDAVANLDTTWWEQFEDPVLNEYISEALANNKDVMIAAANIENAMGVLIQTRSSLFPQVGYNALGTRQRLSEKTATPLSPLIPNPQNLFQAVFTLDWLIDLWGRTRRQIEAAKANLLANIDERRQVILTLVASVANVYIQLIGLDEQLNISKQTLKSYEEAVIYFKKQFAHGQASEMPVAQSETQYQIAAATLPQIQQEIVQAENALSILLGRNPGPIKRGKTIYNLKMPKIPAGIPSDILENRPDIQAAEENLIATNALIGAAKALYFPSISLTGDYGGASEQLKSLFSGPSKIWNFTGNIIGPIFTWGAIYGQVVQAEAEYMGALYNYENIIQNAFAQVEDALSAHTQFQKEFEAQAKLVKAAQRYVELANLQYKGGYSPYFVVIQAQQQLFPAELSWTQTRAQLFSSIVNIFQALGGGWVSIAENLAPVEVENQYEKDPVSTIIDNI